MRSENEYTIIYECGLRRREMFLDDGGSLSFVEASGTKDAESYTEVIVQSSDLHNALDNPALEGSTFTGKMRMLFGCYNGLENFQMFCDEKGIDTMTMIWK